MTSQVIDGELQMELKDGIALLTLIGDQGEFPWGTKREEHRWNLVTLGAINKALDMIEEDKNANVVVLANVGKFWSNGADLHFMDKGEKDKVKECNKLMRQTLARVLTFGLPTVAAIKGHFCAAGGMMGLCFDYRVMSSDQGVFFIPGVDLGGVYPPFLIECMKCKMDNYLQREVIMFNRKRFVAEELAQHGVVDVAVHSSEVMAKALELATSLKPKGTGPARAALGGIKKNVYKTVLDSMSEKGAGGGGPRIKGQVYAPPPKASMAGAKL